MARGLCSKHYQRWRRGSKGQGPGRPRQYAKELTDHYGGAPLVAVRMDPELWRWTQEHGGSVWVRHLLKTLRELSSLKGFSDYWDQLVLEEALQFAYLDREEHDQLREHGGEDLPGEWVGNLWRIPKEELHRWRAAMEAAE